MPIYRLNTRTRSTMLCLSGFKLYSRWVPLIVVTSIKRTVLRWLSQEYDQGNAVRDRRWRRTVNH